ncbi:MAG: hypothetical protein QF498_05635 [Arenicellales bacterium]|nr:hypothetical protein [Arenicellales bacterium]
MNMPSYDYYCAANGRTLEVRHSINDALQNWGQLCLQAEIEQGNTPPESPVKRLISGGGYLSSSERFDPGPGGSSCCGGGCGCG